MAENRETAIRKCQSQLEGLYLYLGSLVVEKVFKDDLRIHAGTENQAFVKEITDLSDEIRELMSPPPESAEPPCAVAMPVNRRGTLEPYVDVNVKLHAAKKKFANLRVDADSCLSMAAVHLKGENRNKVERFLDRLGQTENTINALFEKISGSLRQVIGNKKEAMEKGNATAQFGISKPEKDFLKKTEAQIRDMSQGVDTLIDEAKSLFENIKEFYERDAGERLSERACGRVPDECVREVAPQESEDAAEPEESGEVPDAEDESETDEIGEDEKAAYDEAVPHDPEGTQAPSSGEVPDEDIGTEREDEDDPRENAKQAAFNEGVIQAAERRLASEQAGEKERLQVLLTVFRSLDEETVVEFLVRLLDEVNVIVKMKMVDLLDKIDHPTMEKVYERFMVSPESLLRFKGITGYGKLRPELMKSLMLRAAGDEEPSIRRLAANCVRPEDGNEEIAAIVRLSNDTDDQVARIAIRRLANCRSQFAVTQLIPKLRHANPKIRKEVIGNLKAMAGNDFGYRYDASDREREKAVRAWEKFLTKSKA